MMFCFGNLDTISGHKKFEATFSGSLKFVCDDEPVPCEAELHAVGFDRSRYGGP